MMRSRDIKYYICRECGKKVSTQFGFPSTACIAHLNEHPGMKNRHMAEPINIMILNCFELKGESI